MRSLNRFRSLFATACQSRRLSQAARRASVEMLEGRVLLSTVVVNTIADSTDPVGCATVSLRDAVAVANASTSPTTITFDPTVFATAQTITLSSANGPLELSNAVQGITITGPTAGVTIDGNGTWTAFAIDANVTASLAGLTITDTVGGQPPATSDNIYNAGNLTLNNDHFTVGGIDNAAKLVMTNDTTAAFIGDGIGNEITGTITLGNVTITGLGANSPLGFYNQGTATLNNVSISHVQTGIYNDAGNMTAGNVTVSGNLTASGINNSGFLALSNSSISGSTTVGNSAEGGGVFNAGNGTVTLTNDSIFGNTLSGNATAGGGICNFGNATLIGVNVSGNVLSGGDGSGGGVYNDGTMTLINSTVADNSAPGGNVSGIVEGGGGISNDLGGNITLRNVTIANNTVTGTAGNNSFGGGIYNADVAGNFTLANSIVAGDTVNGVNRDADGNFTSLGNNLIGAIDGNSSGWVASDLTGNTTTPLNANLGALANNGGPTQTLLPLTGSPAIDAGNNSLIPSGILTDQRGLPRIYNTTVDIGAVELQSATATTIYVTPPANQIANTFNSQAFNLGSFAESLATGPYSVDVSWGDGTADTILGNLTAAGAIPAAAHTYAVAGNETVSLTVTDAGNHTSNTATFTVDAARITTVASGSQTASAGVSASFSLGNFSVDNTTGPFTATVNWGDGTNNSIIGNIATAGAIPAAAHTYAAGGVQVVTVTVTDALGHVSNGADFTIGVTAITITPPATQFVHPGTSQSFALGNFTAVNATGPYTATINWGDGSGNATIGNLSAAGAIPAMTHTYASAGNETVTETVADSGNHTSLAVTFTVMVVAPGPASISGTVYTDPGGTGIYSPGDAGIADVMVYLDTNNNGNLDAGEISVNTDASGNFVIGNLTAGTYTLQEVVPGGYVQTGPATGNITVTLISGETLTGQTFFNDATGNATAEAVYRLYSPVTLEHLYTTDPNEYNTLETYVGTWNGEGEVFNEYSGPATVGGVTDESFYRLYNPFVKQHLWTTDLNEYTVLATEGWEQEGVVGYVFPAATGATATSLPTVPNSEALYRMMAPQVHLWTTDVNEYDTLATEGWTGEGIIGYVLA